MCVIVRMTGNTAALNAQITTLTAENTRLRNMLASEHGDPQTLHQVSTPHTAIAEAQHLSEMCAEVARLTVQVDKAWTSEAGHKGS
jgi:hypothetical protein